MPNNTQKLQEILSKLNSDAEFRTQLQSSIVDYVDKVKAQVVRVESAIDLTAAQKKIIESVFKSNNYEYSLNPELIAGIKIIKGDQVTDMSLSGKLTTLTSLYV